MADQASTAAAKAGAESVRLRAEVLAVFACNQLGRGADAGGRAMRALRAAQRAGEETTERLIRVELAACAADASAPSAGLAVLQPVFGRVSSSAPTARAAAMVTAADCVARLGGGSDVAALLTFADQLYDTSRSVEPDAVLLRRGVVHARLAAYHRRRGDHRTAESTARAGLALVEELSDGELDTGQVSGSLTAELVLALLDSGRAAEAVLAAQPVLRRPARPAGAPAACWLRLALVSRVHLPAGRHALVRRLLGEAVADAERNQLDAALAECRQLQAQLHETCAEVGEALQSVRAAHVADRRWRDTAAEFRTLLAAEFGAPAPAAELRSALAGVLAGHRAADLTSVLGRTDQPRPARPVRPVRSRHAAPTPLQVAQTAEAPVVQTAEAPVAQTVEPPAIPPPARPLSPASGRERAAQPSPAGLTEPPSARPLSSQPGAAAESAPSPRSEPGAAVGLPLSPKQAPLPGSVAGAGSAPALAPAPRPESTPLARSAASRPPMTARATTPASEGGSASPAGSAPSSAEPDRGCAQAGQAGQAGRAGEPVAPPSEQVQAVGAVPADGSESSAGPPAEQAPPIGHMPRASANAASGVRSARDEGAGSAEAEVAERSMPPKDPAGGTGWPARERRRRARPPAAEQVGQDEPAAKTGAADGEDAGEPPVTNGFDRGSGRHRSDVAMADLLAEALLAYQNGRRSRLAAAAGGVSLESAAADEAQQPAEANAPEPPDASGPRDASGRPDALKPREESTPRGAPGRPDAPKPPDDRTAPPAPAAAVTAPRSGPPPAPSTDPGATAARQGRVRWIDLPREVVWREPGRGRRH